MTQFSLITCSIGRVDDLHTLLESIASQNISDLEWILVDQNPDDRLGPVVETWRSKINIVWLRAKPGLSRSRNVGLEAATGNIIAFPDDDCWYPADVLDHVRSWFVTHPGYSVLTVGANDRDGISSGNRWIRSECDITPVNSFRTTFSSTIFIRRTQAFEGAQFNPSLGVGSGTQFVCGEETDYVLRILKKGERGFFTRKWAIGHPRRDMLSGQVDTSRALKYGRGMGYVLMLHRLRGLWGLFILYDLLRALISVLRLRFSACTLCLQHARGVVSGGLAKQE